jgi:hypothetical protein
MTNQDLVTNWKTLGLRFKGKRKIHKLVDPFMICWGEAQDELELNDGSKVKVVIFDTGGAMGSPSLWCHSDEKDNCWELRFDRKSQKFIQQNIGKFVKV